MTYFSDHTNHKKTNGKSYLNSYIYIIKIIIKYSDILNNVDNIMHHFLIQILLKGHGPGKKI